VEVGVGVVVGGVGVVEVVGELVGGGEEWGRRERGGVVGVWMGGVGWWRMSRGGLGMRELGMRMFWWLGGERVSGGGMLGMVGMV
uniref:hypothetical protein n=1 Tax=Rhodococcus hoagii TaxID=43767 RepID=UPI001C92D23F